MDDSLKSRQQLEAEALLAELLDVDNDDDYEAVARLIALIIEAAAEKGRGQIQS